MAMVNTALPLGIARLMAQMDQQAGSCQRWPVRHDRASAMFLADTGWLAGWGRIFESVDLDPDSIVLFVDFVLDRPDRAGTA